LVRVRYSVGSVAAKTALAATRRRFSELIKHAPDDLELHDWRAFAYRNLNRYDLAIADLTKLIEKQPNDAEAYRRRVCSYRLANNYEKAVTDFRKVLELRPGDADATARLKFAESKLRTPPRFPTTPIPASAGSRRHEKPKQPVPPAPKPRPRRVHNLSLSNYEFETS